jgi:hypothetical protein
MFSMNLVFAYMAPQPSRPVASMIAIIIGVALILGQNWLGLVTRWVRRGKSGGQGTG